MADDLGFQAIQQEPEDPKDDGLGFQPIPKMPDMSGVKKLAQDNLAANDNSGKTPAQKLDTAVNAPVSSWISGGDKETPLHPDVRGEYVKSIQAGTSTNFGDFMQSTLHAVAPIAMGIAHPIDTGAKYAKSALESGTEMVKAGAGLLAYPFVSEENKEELRKGYELTDYKNPESPTAIEQANRALELEQATIGRGMGALYAPVAAALSPAVSPLIESTSTTAQKLGAPSDVASLIPKAAGAAMDIFGGVGILHGAGELKSVRPTLIDRSRPPTLETPPAGPWDDHPGADAVKQPIADAANKPVDAVTSPETDHAIFNATNDKAPPASDFKDVAVATGSDESTLHVIFKQTGVKPEQVFEEAARNPEILDDIRSGNVPEDFPVEPTSAAAPEKLDVAPDKATSTFNVVDKDGDHVRGGFDSAEEARQYIDDKIQSDAIEKQLAEVEKSTAKAPSAKKEVAPSAEKPVEKAPSAALDVAGKQGEQLAAANEGRLKPSAAQKAPDEGLFDVSARSQGDIFDQKPNNEANGETASDASSRISRSSGADVTLENGLNNQIKLSGIKVPESQQGAGVGNRALKLIKDFSDATGRNIVLTAQALSADKQVALERFYERNGFVKFGKDPLSGKPYYGYKAKLAAEKTKPNIILPSETGKPTSLRSFLSNNGAKFNEANELVSIKKNGERVAGEAALEHAHEIAKEQGYLPKDESGQASKPVTDLQNAITESNGGREVFRDTDADRVAKAKEALESRKNLDPARIEHEAHSAGIETDPIKGESEKQRTKRLLKELNEFWKNQEGSAASDILRQAMGGTIKAAEKFVGKLTGNLYEKLAEGYIRTFQPELMGPIAKRFDAYLAKFKARGQEAANAFYLADLAEMKRFDKMTPEARQTWRYDHEVGRWNEEENPDHAKEQAIYDAMHKAEHEAGVSDAAYKQNYLPHQWEDAEAVKNYFNSDAYIKKYGTDWFTKRSVFQLTQDAERAGFKLKTDNPIKMRIARQVASDVALRTMNLLKDAESNGAATRTSLFTLDKKIAKTEASLVDLETKLKEANDKINDPRQERWDFANPAVSKLMQTMAERIEKLKNRLDGFNKEKTDNKLTPQQMEALKNGFKIIGPDNKAWNIHQQAAPLWRNAMEMKGLYEREGFGGNAYRSYSQIKNIYTDVKLSLSLFHPTHEVLINVAGALVAPIYHLIQGGKFSDLAWKDVTDILPFAESRGIDAYNTPRGERTAEQQADVDRMTEGGFVPTMSAQDRVHFKDNFDKAIAGVGLNNLRLIGTALSLPGKVFEPLFSRWIPRLRSQMYFSLTDKALMRDPSLVTDAGRRAEAFREISQNIDRGYGQLNQETLFWDKNVKDAFNASYISGGWKLAQIYNVRGLLQPANIAYKFAKTGKFSKADITYNILQAYAYTGVTLAFGAMVNKALGNPVGKTWEEAKDIKDYVWEIIKDCQYPVIGKNPDGTKIRASQPSFIKEWFMAARDIDEQGLIGGAGKFIYEGTLIPAIKTTLSVLGDGLSDALQMKANPIGKDGLGRAIIQNPLDYHQWMNAGWDMLNPITLSSYEHAEEKGTSLGKTLGLLGMPLAGGHVDESPFEHKFMAVYHEQNPSKDDAYTAKLKVQMRGAVTNKDTDAQKAIADKMKENGMTANQIAFSKKPFETTYEEYAWSKISHKEQKRLIESATPKEKEKYKIKSQ